MNAATYTRSAEAADVARPSLLARVMRHVFDVLHNDPVRMIELEISGANLTVGVWLMIPWKTFVEVPHYIALIRVAEALPGGEVLGQFAEPLWGAVFVLLGLAPLISSALLGTTARRRTAVGVCMALAFIAVILYSSGSHAAIVPLFGYAAMKAVWVSWRLRDKELEETGERKNG